MVAPTERFANFPDGARTRGRIADAVTTTLREAILDGALPPSAWLREEELAGELQVSRTPVREALRRLTAEGLTIRSPGGGTIVAPMTIEDLLAVYVVRESLEGLAARVVAERGPPGVVAELRAHVARMREVVEAGDDLQAIVQSNIEFHRCIRQASGNPYLERFLTQVEHAIRRFGRTTFEIPGRGEEAIAEHELIVEAIAARDGEAAERHASEHMHHARDIRARMLIGR